MSGYITAQGAHRFFFNMSGAKYHVPRLNLAATRLSAGSSASPDTCTHYHGPNAHTGTHAFPWNVPIEHTCMVQNTKHAVCRAHDPN